MTVEPEWAILLGRLAIDDELTAEPVPPTPRGDGRLACLDDKARWLVSLAALVAIGAATPSYQQVVGLALATGATEGEIVDVLLAVAPIVGRARVTSAAPDLATALGWNLDESYGL